MAPHPPPPSHGHLLPEEHPERHEHTDVPTRPLKIFFVIMLIVGIAIHGGLYWLFDVYDIAEQERDKTRIRSGLHRTREEKLPPAPRLQGVPTLSANTARQDADMMRAENDRMLSSYGIVEPGKTARIPIDRAMDIALQRGFKKSETTGTRPAN